MLNLAPQHDRLLDARDLLRIVELGRSTIWVLRLLLLTLLGVALLLSGLAWGGLLIGGAASLALSRCGPRWWPGKR